MEQFAYPYAEYFFGDKADKFRFAHLQEALTFVPFGVAVDEYQHIIYANPDLTPKQRTAEWKKLEEKYMPWREYGDIEFFAKGGWWYHKIHIFLYPFYYLLYKLHAYHDGSDGIQEEDERRQGKRLERLS